MIGVSKNPAVLAFALLFIPTFVIVKLLARSLGGRTQASSWAAVGVPASKVLNTGLPSFHTCSEVAPPISWRVNAPPDPLQALGEGGTPKMIRHRTGGSR